MGLGVIKWYQVGKGGNVREKVAADLNAGIKYKRGRQKRGVGADADLRADNRVRADVGVFADDGQLDR